ncbi:unnamed protein product, partial [Rotaria sp. Silwood2]
VLLKYTIKLNQTAIDIEDISTIQDEEEVLVLPFSVFKIKNIIENRPNMSSPMLIEIDLEECEDDEQINNKKQEIPLRGSLVDIHPNAKWNNNGQTVAGQNPSLSKPQGLYVGDNQTVYVADYGNHRIVAWKSAETNGQVVVGEHGQGNDAHQLDKPTDVIVDKERDSLIICDRGNKRVVRWPRQNGTSGETIISNISCVALTMDENGSLYATDWDKDEVRRYRMGESQGTVVAGGNGQGHNLNQLSLASYIFVDREHSVFVSDFYNHRVMKWIEGAKIGSVVASGQGQENYRTQLRYPKGVLVDQLGTVYVADEHNHRIIRWAKKAKEGDVIVGGDGYGAQANQLYLPKGLSFDRHGNLYVVDQGNNRVQRFTIEMPSN